jgi:hypothetical protein
MLRYFATSAARGLRAVHSALMLLIVAAASPAAGQEGSGRGAGKEKEGSRLSGLIQLDLSNAYFFRGFLQERDGLIFRPRGELYVSLVSEDDGLIRDVSLGGGVWVSIHSQETGARHGPRSVYEVDWYPSVSVQLAGSVSVTATYYYFTSPNGAFDRIDELDVTLAWDDAEVLGRWALRPWATLFVETQGTAFGDEEGTGLELGVEPTLYSFDHPTYPVTLSVPLQLGLGIEDYYETEGGGENFFGYFQWGLAASVPMPFVPENLGTWTLTLKGSAMTLSPTLEEVNEGRGLYPVFTAGLGVTF